MNLSPEDTTLLPATQEIQIAASHLLPPLPPSNALPGSDGITSATSYVLASLLSPWGE